MNILLKILRGFAVFALVIYALQASFANRGFALSLSSPNTGVIEFVSDWEIRIQRVINVLPENVTVIGYLADWDLPGDTSNPVDQDNEYMLTQYALAPINVVPGIEQEWILGNFTTPNFQVWLDQTLTDYELVEFGYGIYLIRRTMP